MKFNNKRSAIILPLKENFSNKNFGAVSVWVSEYLKYSKINTDIIFCRKLSNKEIYLNKNVIPISVGTKYYTNQNYIRKINLELIERKIEIVEIHNRPEYASYLIENNPKININLIFHNDPNKLRDCTSSVQKEKFLKNCNKLIFVSKWVKKKFFEKFNFQHEVTCREALWRNNKYWDIYNYSLLKFEENETD